MAASSTSQQQPRIVTVEEGKTFCKCDEGWVCDFTKNDPSKAGKPFSKCGDSCICITDVPEAEATKATDGKVFVRCGEGWTCTVSKTDGADAGKVFLQCGEGCTCSINGTNAVKFATA